MAKIIESLSPRMNPVSLPDVRVEASQVTGRAEDSDIEKTPTSKFVVLPGDNDVPPPYETTSSGGTGRSSGTATTAGTGTTTKSHTTASSGAMGLRETVQSPPPTPDSDILLPPHPLTQHLPSNPHSPSASQHTLVPPPPPADPQAIREQLLALVAAQNAQDHVHDLADLRALMREAIATASDAEMIGVLQVRREEMPEALKTLQRALEKEQEREREASEGVGAHEIEPAGEEPVEAFSDSEAGVNLARRGSQTSALGLRGIPGFPGLKRRRTDASAKSKGSRKNGTTSTKAASAVDESSARGSGWSGSSKSTESGRDTLDREFIESGIDALRRVSMSRGQDLNLPNWTITRFVFLLPL